MHSGIKALYLLPEDAMAGRYRRLKAVEYGQCDDDDEGKRENMWIRGQAKGSS